MLRKERNKRNFALGGKKLSSLAMLALLTPLLTGCAPRIIIHPITGKDIYKGTADGDVCFSKLYLDEVMQVKIEKAP